ncbi:hypothetical protein EVG20_g10156 [Dentipellis fragilis]|uniref:DUF659 domain-containing protein n=1 Tax=Dentipellis fragilis TaxID=205917 RepID=A0A4Y9XUB1_9AGAM|nr:hypothetical protein EVG20_g10156 [Dentipellis fragilis]
MMHRLLSQKRLHITTVPCWAHQVNLVVGDYLKRNVASRTVVNRALEIVKWFNNHSRAIGILKDVQLKSSTTGIPLCLILPVLTRWTSHFLSISHLLELESCFLHAVAEHGAELEKCTGKEKTAVVKAKEIVQIIKDSQFWFALRLIKQDLEPLAIAAQARPISSDDQWDGDGDLSTAEALFDPVAE